MERGSGPSALSRTEQDNAGKKNCLELGGSGHKGEALDLTFPCVFISCLTLSQMLHLSEPLCQIYPGGF